MLNIVGEVVKSPDGNIAEVCRITIFAEGPIMVKGKDEEELKKKAGQAREIVFRAMECAGCGICVSRCKTGALILNGKVTVDIDRCEHCGTLCLGRCPVIKFREEELDI